MSVAGKLRTATGKKATKELRKEGYVPCNLYGEAKGEDGKPLAKAFAILATDLRKLVYTPHVYVANIDIEGEKHTAVMKEIQFHPTTDAILHIDFFEINEEKPLTIGIPVHLVGLAQGIRDGGRMNLSIRKIEVTAPFRQIPEQLDIDVTDLKLITDEDAKAIFKKNYWDRWQAAKIRNQSIANILVDWVWGSGAYGIKIPQKILGVKVDGIVGPKTLAALNAQDEEVFFAKLKREREAYFRRICIANPSQSVFLKGWLKRLDGIQYGKLVCNAKKKTEITF